MTPGGDTNRVTTRVLERTSTSTESVTTRAHAYAIDPSTEQANNLRSHIGASRFAYNTLLGLVKDDWDGNRAKKDAGIEVTQEDWVDTSHFGLLYLCAEHRNERAPWWAENPSLAKHIADASWGEFGRQLEYKTAWYGSALVRADTFYPSSKTCSQCRTVKATLSVDERMFHCETCGLVIDRDLNAAINLARKGRPGTNSGTGRRGEVSPAQQKLAVTAHPDETSTDPSPDVDGVGDASV